MTENVQPLRVASVDLIPESYRTHRELVDGHPTRYPVRLWLSRPLDPFEQVTLHKVWSDVIVIAEDPKVLIVPNTTLEKIRDGIDGLHSNLDEVVNAARDIREEAEAEDRRLNNLVGEIKAQLKATNGS